ncbi:MAG: gspG [Candidatus Parcubacteria bacterium]|nr:gspG [Candidatus Parcubacteria bacterium]
MRVNQQKCYYIVMEQTQKGFTLIELLVVLSIIGMLASIVLVSVNEARDKAYLGRAKQELYTIWTALELYQSEHNGQYPDDVDRNIPPGLGPYIAGGNVHSWPNAPWPGSVYDWDNWSDLPTPVDQISIRFCPLGGDLSDCQFPKAAWAQNFQVNSAVYWCVSGPCTAHRDENVPGYCVNCAVQPDP